MNDQTNPAGPIRLLLVEDHVQLAIALTAGFETVDDIDVVGQAGTVEEAVSATLEHRPDLVLLDRLLPDGDAVESIGRLREQHPSTTVLVFTGEADRAIADRVRAAGGNGLVQKAGRLDELVRTIRRVAGGADAFEPDPLEPEALR